MSRTTTERDTELYAAIADCVRRALEEDIRTGDVTTNSIVPVDARLRGNIVAKQSGVVAGLEVATMVFEQLSKDVTLTANVNDG
ncbi:MAG TPA: hypothetical protein VLA93_01450, partial [Pyrinomonadaceae bacterium]|nr:hypothetical protein [Pyrinomonadaceae bacterium]